MYEWCSPTGGRMFAGNAGLASDAQACIELGNWDYIGFERDPVIWKLSCDVVTGHMTTLDRKEREIRAKIKTNKKLLPILQKVKDFGISALTDAEVHFCTSPNAFKLCRKNFTRAIRSLKKSKRKRNML